MSEIKAVLLAEYLMDRPLPEATADLLTENASTTVSRVNQLLTSFGQYRKVTSGFRPLEYNANIPNASSHSNHIICKACDLEDQDGELDAFCMNNFPILEVVGLWLEHPSDTPGWCHVQTVPPKSKKRVFFA